VLAIRLSGHRLFGAIEYQLTSPKQRRVQPKRAGDVVLGALFGAVNWKILSVFSSNSATMDTSTKLCRTERRACGALEETVLIRHPHREDGRVVVGHRIRITELRRYFLVSYRRTINSSIFKCGVGLEATEATEFDLIRSHRFRFDRNRPAANASRELLSVARRRGLPPGFLELSLVSSQMEGIAQRTLTKTIPCAPVRAVDAGTEGRCFS